MSIINKSKFKSDETTGFGSNGRDNSGRYFHKSGTPNVRKVGIGRLESISWFHSLINMSTKTFLALIFAGFVGINVIFTFIYLIIGINHLSGIRYGSAFQNFMEVFFFSTQTFTTVGYGRISPMGILTSGVSTFEAFIGLLSFALATGLFFARFSKPDMFLRYSKKALISKYKNHEALMFRIASFKNNLLTDVEVKLTLAIRDFENGQSVNRFYPLELTISKINSLVLSWTIVHVLDEDSPLYGFESKDFEETPFEILVFIKAFDESYSNQVISRHSYVNTEMIHGAKYKMMYRSSEDGSSTILDFDLIDSYEKHEAH
jgi:inward rectifier potassium channel